MFNELRSFDPHKRHWTLLTPDLSLEPAKRVAPLARTAHGLCAWEDKLVVFGGSGSFVKEVGLREAYNDLWLFDTVKLKWR